MRLLIDECLSQALAREAQQAGIEAYHLAHLGRAGWQDPAIVEFAVARDMVIVTNNASDFRRLYAARDLHPGLVILVPNVERESQLRLFRVALAHLVVMQDVMNRALEVDIEGESVSLRDYEWPRPVET